MSKIIHKRNTSEYSLGGEALCGRWYSHYTFSSYLWKNVTCKNCLKLKNKKKKRK